MENGSRRLTEFPVTFQCFWSFWHFPFLWWKKLFKTLLFWSVSPFWGGTGWVFAKTTLRNLLSPIFSTPCPFLGCCKPWCIWPRRPNHDRWWAVYIAASEKEVRGQPNKKHKTRQMRSEDIGSMWYQTCKQTEHAMKLEPWIKMKMRDYVIALYGTIKDFLQFSLLSFERRRDVIQFCAWQTQCLKSTWDKQTNISFEGIMKLFKSLWVPFFQFVDIHILSIGSCLEAWFDGFWPHKSMIWHGTRKCIDRWFKVQMKPNSGFLERLSNS